MRLSGFLPRFAAARFELSAGAVDSLSAGSRRITGGLTGRLRRSRECSSLIGFQPLGRALPLPNHWQPFDTHCSRHCKVLMFWSSSVYPGSNPHDGQISWEAPPLLVRCGSLRWR